MKKPTNFHLAIIILQTLGEKHKVVIMTPDNIPFFIVLIYNICKHLVGLFVSIKLRLETPGCRKSVFLGKAKIVKKRPKDVITVSIIILMNNFLVKINWNAPLYKKNIKKNEIYVVRAF